MWRWAGLEFVLQSSSKGSCETCGNFTFIDDGQSVFIQLLVECSNRVPGQLLFLVLYFFALCPLSRDQIYNPCRFEIFFEVSIILPEKLLFKKRLLMRMIFLPGKVTNFFYFFLL